MPLSDLDFDRQHIWHPYSSMTAPLPMFQVASANGVTLTLENGSELIDGMASWWSVIHGYNHPTLNNAITNQLGDMAHVMFGGLTHKPAIDLARKLIELTPSELSKVFFADSGSVAVEVALKMALQFWQSQGNRKKHRFISLMNGYHGDTFGAMAVTDPVNGMHHMFKGVLPEHIFAPAPGEEGSLDALEKLIKAHHEEVAALILEPIVQGAGGMRFYKPEYLKQAKALCEQFNILLIADEIATGFGRTGKLFACEHADITPDILCLGKAITGGYMSFAATLCTENIAKTISNGEAGVFMHGPTFMANPLACSVANASLNLLATSDWQTQINSIQTQLESSLSDLREAPNINDVRVFGAIGVVEMTEPVDMQTIQPAFVEEGVWVRPFGKLVYVMPAYTMTSQELDKLTSGIKHVITAYA